MMRCCKDLGVASELWDPRFVRQHKAKYAKEVFVEHQVTKKRTKITLRKVNSNVVRVTDYSADTSSFRRTVYPILMRR